MEKELPKGFDREAEFSHTTQGLLRFKKNTSGKKGATGTTEH